MKSNQTKRFVSRRRGANGFTLIELTIAMTVFLVIGAAAISLFQQHAALFSDQQYQIGLNVSLRNALSQMENDVVNAGTGWYNASNSVASWPVGVKIVNNVLGGAACHPPGTPTYNTSCFDVLSLVVPDPFTPPGQVYVAPGTAGCATPALTGNTGATGTLQMTIAPILPTTQAQLLTGYQTGGGFTAGSQVIFIHVGTSGTTMTTAILTAAAASGANVLLTFNATRSDGANPNAANDPLNLTTLANLDTALIPLTLTDSFCSGTDWVVKIAPIKYWVDTTVATNPTLTRTENGLDNPIASQIIGFKVGASSVTMNGTNTAAAGSTGNYCYDAAQTAPPCYDNNFDEIRSIRISLIGRTPPNLYINSNTARTTLFTNSFDQQSYKVQSLSVIVNPRNLSMND
jgi:prepilin-type N-terminal cleavage/methylation domain-containing protein